MEDSNLMEFVSPFMTLTIFERTQGVRCVQNIHRREFFNEQHKRNKHLRPINTNELGNNGRAQVSTIETPILQHRRAKVWFISHFDLERSFHKDF